MPSLFGGSGGQTKQEKALTQTETNIANYGFQQAQSTIPAATSGLESSLNFFQTLLSGDRNAIAALEAPDIMNTQQQYEAARKTSDEFSPRGGGATAANEESRFSEASDIAKLFTQARSTGAAGVASLSQLLAGLGTSELGQSSTTAANTVGQLQTSQQMQQQQQAGLGAGIGSLVALLTS
jgi:hypothetical protein